MSNYKSDNLVGNKFARLTVVSLSHTDKNPWGRGKRRYWNCICECGNTLTVLGRSLSHNNTKSCGCYHRDRMRAVLCKRPYERLYNHFIHTAAKQKWITEFSYEDFVNLTHTKLCHYCRGNIVWTGTAYNIDRMDSNLGYSKENCVVCCTRCNRGKSDLFTYSEWRAMTEIFRRAKC